MKGILESWKPPGGAFTQSRGKDCTKRGRRSGYNQAALKRFEKGLILGGFGLALAASALSCGGPGRPADRIETVRALYHAEVTGFVVERPAGVAQAAAPAAAPAETAAIDSSAPADSAAVPETAPSPTGDESTGLVAPAAAAADVRLDVRLSHSPGEELSGLTLEVGLLDTAGAEKEHYRIWVDAAGMAGGEKKVSYQLEDVPYVEGDRFVASVRSPVPAAERSLYKEFPVAP
jgi:hypothetical protein